MIKVEEPSKQKLQKIKIGSVSGACPFLMPQRDEDKGVMTTYKFFVPDPKENEEKDSFEDNDKENE